MKKYASKLLILLAILILVACAGFAGKKNTAQIHLLFDGKEVFCEEMEVDYFKYLEVKILFGGDFNKHYKNKHSGSYTDYISSLDSVFASKLKDEVTNFDCEAIEPKANYLGEGKFNYEIGKDGLKCNMEALGKLIVEGFESNMVINIPYSFIAPKEKYNELIERTKKLSGFTTNYRTSSENRKKNIALAASRLNNSQIESGQTLSFNQVVGARTEENGFFMAKIIKNGEFTAGVGGGVCQVSTTLFNAWLLAGLEVEKSSTHSLPVSYVAPSLDAMVSSETDLVLKNSSPHTIYLNAFCEDNKLTFEIYGKSCGYVIKLRSVKIRDIVSTEYEVVEPIPIPEGAEFEYVIEKEPISGMLSESYRDFFAEGKLLTSERLRRSVYAPQKGKKSKIVLSTVE